MELLPENATETMVIGKLEEIEREVDILVGRCEKSIRLLSQAVVKPNRVIDLIGEVNSLWESETFLQHDRSFTLENRIKGVINIFGIHRRHTNDSLEYLAIGISMFSLQETWNPIEEVEQIWYHRPEGFEGIKHIKHRISALNDLITDYNAYSEVAKKAIRHFADVIQNEDESEQVQLLLKTRQMLGLPL